jgi:hypothetical protein
MLVRTPNLAPHRVLHVYFSSSDMLATSRRTEQEPWKQTSINTNKDSRQHLIQASYSRGALQIEAPTSRQRLHGMQENVRAHASARHPNILWPGAGLLEILRAFLLCKRKRDSIFEHVLYISAPGMEKQQSKSLQKLASAQHSFL